MKKLFALSVLALLLLVQSAEAAKRVAFPGGIYGDSLPGGEYALLLNGNLVTHIGSTPLPEQMIFTRITNAGGFKVALKSAVSDKTWTFVAGAWAVDGRISHGVQGHIWNPTTGELVVMKGIGDQDSQGFRYYDPAAGPDGNMDVTHSTPDFVTGSPSYNPLSPFARRLGVQKLYEWTHIDGIIVGQGEEGGAVIQYRGKRYTLEPGDTRFIQFHKAGDTLSVAMSKLREREVVLHWLNTGEIEALPAYVDPPVVAPIPAPTPAPVPEQLQASNERATVEAVLAAHPEVNAKDENQRAFIVDWVGQRLNKRDGTVRWGRKSRGKPNGTKAVNPNTDALTFLRTDGRFEIYDVINGGNGKAAWDKPTKSLGQGENGYWVPPQLGPEEAVVTPPPTPTPTPTPPAGQPTTAELIARIDALEAALRAEMVTQTDREIAKLDEMKVAIIKAAKDLEKFLPLLGGGGLGSIFGGKK